MALICADKKEVFSRGDAEARRRGVIEDRGSEEKRIYRGSH